MEENTRNNVKNVEEKDEISIKMSLSSRGNLLTRRFVIGHDVTFSFQLSQQDFEASQANTIPIFIFFPH